MAVKTCAVLFNLFIFFSLKLTLVAMEPNVRDEITSINRASCVSRGLYLKLQKKKPSVELAVFKSKCKYSNLIFFNFALSGLVLHSAACKLS